MKVIKNIFILITVMFLFNITVNAKTIKVKECDYTDEFEAYMKLSEEERKNTITPSMCKQKSSYAGSLASTSYETRYDLRDDDYVTSVKDQGNSNLCWTFATTASLESNLLKRGNDAQYLSEAEIALTVQNTGGVFSTKTFNEEFNSPGNFLKSSAAILRSGLGKESSLPFSYVSDILAGRKTFNEVLSLYTSNTNQDSLRTDVDNIFLSFDEKGPCSNEDILMIKEYLTNNGALGALINVGESEDSSFISGDKYIYNNSNNINHAITIVGWDDDFNKGNFGITPSRNGAWIIKNSWGTSRGEAGYYYVSYDDNTVCKNLGGFYNASKYNHDYAYYHDYLGYVGDLEFGLDEEDNPDPNFNPDYLYLKTDFKAHDGNQKIDKIMFYISNFNQSYKVYFGNEEIASGTSKYPGYISVKPSNTLEIDGDFSIKVAYDVRNITKSVPAAYAYSSEEQEIYEYASYIPSSGSETSLTSISDDNNHWVELKILNKTGGTAIADSTIRVYTSNYSGSNSNNNDNNNNNNNDNNNNNNNNNNNSENELVLVENENNEESYMVFNKESKNDTANPPTLNSTNTLFYIAIGILVLAFVLSSIRLKKIKSNM